MGGRAVHKATEEWERDPDRVDIRERWKVAWAAELDAARANCPDESLWYVGGRRRNPTTREFSAGEGESWWLEHGEEMCLAYQTALAEKNWHLWLTPLGEPAIELGMMLPLGGVLIRAFIDRVYVTGDGELIVVDLKTGSRKPANGGQLGVYACGFERAFGVRPSYGVYYMARTATWSLPIMLDTYTQEVLGQQFATASAIWEAGLFLANPDQHCNYCRVKDFCRVGGGHLWREFEGLTPPR